MRTVRKIRNRSQSCRRLETARGNRQSTERSIERILLKQEERVLVKYSNTQSTLKI
jgi:hypothetical protein